MEIYEITDYEKERGVYLLNNGDIVIVLNYIMPHEVGCRIRNKMHEIKYSLRDYWFRCTDNPEEASMTDIKSKNQRDGITEAGMSVSEHTGYQMWGGYKYIYPVTGDVVGTGSDGEPLLTNTKPLDKPRKNLTAKWRKKAEAEEHLGLSDEAWKKLSKPELWKNIKEYPNGFEKAIKLFYF